MMREYIALQMEWIIFLLMGKDHVPFVGLDYPFGQNLCKSERAQEAPLSK